MRAAILRGRGDVAVCAVPDPWVQEPTDAVVRVVVAAICGTDLRGYEGRPGPVQGPRCGHEFVGVVADVGSEVARLRRGDVVVAPFFFADGTCFSCRQGLSTSCRAGGMFGVAGDGGQAEGVRVPFADATLVRVPIDETDERLPAIVALCDVMATGHHAIESALVDSGATVAVVGDGAVGLCSVLAAFQAGAGQIILLGKHEKRCAVGTAFGATDIISSRGEEAAHRVRELTAGVGVDVVVDCVGEKEALDTALGACRDGGVLSIVGGPHGDLNPLERFLRNVTVTGGIAPSRTYLPNLLNDVLAGRIDPSPVFDLSVPLSSVAAGYEAMRMRTAIKVLVRP